MCGRKKTLYDRFVRWAVVVSGKASLVRWRAPKMRRTAVHRQQLHQGPTLCGRQRRGPLAYGIGHTKGGRNTKLHAVCDAKGRPDVLLLKPRNVHDCKVARTCIAALPPSIILMADKGYDS